VFAERYIPNYLISLNAPCRLRYSEYDSLLVLKYGCEWGSFLVIYRLRKSARKQIVPFIHAGRRVFHKPPIGTMSCIIDIVSGFLLPSTRLRGGCRDGLTTRTDQMLPAIGAAEVEPPTWERNRSGLTAPLALRMIVQMGSQLRLCTR
jgi:hypothetical protein